MAITFLKAVNRVLVKLRESQLTTLAAASAYPSLIAAFINESKEEVETAWQWTYLRTSIDITTVANTSTYAITGAGEEFIIDSVWDVSRANQLNGPSPNFYVDRALITTSLQSASSACWVDVLGFDANGDPTIRITPTPSANGVIIRVFGRKKQAYLETSTDSSVLLVLPWKPVVYGAYVKALSERGEDGGILYDEASRTYERALADSIALDARNNHIGTDWYPE